MRNWVYLFSGACVCGFAAVETDPVFFAEGDVALPRQASSGYSAPSAFSVRNPYGVFFDASYLLWFVDEEGLDIATSLAYNSSQMTLSFGTDTGQILMQPSNYTSGFKLGCGYQTKEERLGVRAEYTYLNHSSSQSIAAANPGNGQSAWGVTSWFLQTGVSGQSLAATAFPSRWDLFLNWIDFVVDRSFYSGRYLTLDPFFGIRGSWLTQSLRIKAQNTLNNSSPGIDLFSHNHLQSWGVGPRAGFNGRWLLGSDWKFIGGMGASLLYTRYIYIKHSEDPFVVGGNPVSFRYDGYGSVRPAAEANIGLAWGTYFCDNRYHVDLSATYEWNYLWSQNMLRYANDQWIFGTGAAAGNLAFHGLTATVLMHF